MEVYDEAKSKIWQVLWLTGGLLFFNPLSAAAADLAPLFTSHDPINVELTADWSKIARDRAAEPAYYEGSLRLEPHQPSNTLIPLKIRPRGKSRRNKDNCGFPPLRLNFSTKQMVDTAFAGQDKLKLVTHCARLGVTARDFSDRLHSEYLLYRILNLLTPNSFQVRRLNITYSHQDKPNKRTSTHPAFLIEHKSALAARTGTQLAERAVFSLESLDANQAELGAMFAYFAGNTDFSFTRGPETSECCHNSVALQGGDVVLPVPYDFDSTGFVDPPYAAPAVSLKLKKVTQRLYRGFCSHQGELEAVRQRFLSVQASIEQLIQHYPDISDKRRKKLKSYTAGFFATLSDPKLFERRIKGRCR